jgi:hypothetical protein
LFLSRRLNKPHLLKLVILTAAIVLPSVSILFPEDSTLAIDNRSTFHEVRHNFFLISSPLLQTSQSRDDHVHAHIIAVNSEMLIESVRILDDYEVKKKNEFDNQL